MANTNSDRRWSGAPAAVLLAVVLYILYQLLPVIELMVIATLIAIVLRTLLSWVQRVVKVRWLAVTILVGLLTGFGIFLTAVVIPNVIAEVQLLLLELPDYLNKLSDRVERLHQDFTFIPSLSQGVTQLRNLTDQLLQSVPLWINQIFDLTIQTFATLILALYIAYDPKTIISGMLRLIPRRHHPRVRRVLKASQLRLQGWIFGTGIAMLFLGVSATLGMWALGIPLALPFGVIAGIFEIIPYFGSIIGTLLPALVALTLSPIKLILVIVLFLILNQVDAHLVQPLVMGREVNLHPVMVIVTFLVMGKLLGLIGVVLAVPIAAILVTILDEFLAQTSDEQKIVKPIT